VIKERCRSSEKADLLAQLAAEIALAADTDGSHATAVPGLTLHRRSAPAAPMPCIYGFGLGLVAQGRKRSMVNSEVYDYEAGDAMLATVDLPMVSSVTVASPAAPFLGLALVIDAHTVLQQAAELAVNRSPPECAYRPIAFESADAGVLATLIKLVQLVHEPALIPHIAPLVQREIVIRLLHGNFSTVLCHLIAVGSPRQQVVKAANWLKQNFTRELRVDELAAAVHMSPSSFRQHFRNVTGLSPLRYQKHLRLQEARYLMLSQRIDAGSAAVRVGYDSASQFSREYARLFGEPPLRDIQRMCVP
jgi:AraC-like DNA-binding protein